MSTHSCRRKGENIQHPALKLGVSHIDITPPVGVTLSGYSPRVSNGVGHRLRAEALYCQGSAGAWVLVTSDLIGYPQRFVKDARRQIARATGLSPDAILISGTHTHSGPSVLWFGNGDAGDVDKKHAVDLQEQLVSLAVAAQQAAAPGRFEVAWSEAPQLGSNRRIQRADGQWVNEWEDDHGQHPGYFDPTIMLVGVCRPDRPNREALVVNYGVHPVVLGPASLAISADYVGYLKDALEAAGQAETVLFALAGGANINPRTCIKVGAEHPRRMGEILAGIVGETTARLSPVAGTRVASHRQAWNFTRTRGAEKQPARPGTARGDTLATEIQVLRAGDLAIIALPGELFSEYNRMLREASPFPHTLVISLANDYIGYLPTDAAQAEGAYETRMAPAEGLEAMIMDQARQAFAAVADQVVN
jgi:hypothetical protein